MSEWLLPAGVAIAAVALTYFFCVRPMRRGHCASTTTERPNRSTDVDRALEQARTELARLRSQANRDGRMHSPVPPSTQDGAGEDEHR